MTFVAAGVTAAEIAAMEAAAIAAAEIAATEAAAAAAATAATEAAAASTATGILEAAVPEILAPEVLTPGIGQGITTPVGIEQIVPGTGAEVLPPAGSQPLPPAGSQPLQFADASNATSDVAQYGQDKSILDMMQNFKPGPEIELSPEVLQASGNAPIEYGPDNYNFDLNRPDVISELNTGPFEFPQVEVKTAADTYYDPALKGHMESYSTDQNSSLGKGFEKALGYLERNPFTAMSLGYTALNQLGAFSPNNAQMPDKKYKGSLSNYRMSPNFQPSRATPNVYTPRYAAQGGIMMAAGGTYNDEPMSDDDSYAQGGIASYARGRRVSSQDELNEYMKMMEGEAISPAPAPDYVGKVGIMRDEDPDTKYKDALTASMIRMGKVNSRANYSPYKNMKRPNAMGGINLSAPGIKPAESKDDREDYASGGITQADRYNMGGYASGSVPRLLKGPGDGMSDDIPASIDNRQPARLADGEFVIPADVVSHLGNGSTEAGAKKLHKMMTDLRKDRTGNPKQGKQIVAEKYLPKKSRKA
jgi:hypothetical protein